VQYPILHHFPASPFAEKVRRVLGFKGMEWQSVIIPAILPKPDVIALTGGYRRTPLLQIGGDVYCDTVLICRVLERIAPSPTLFPYGDTLSVEALSRFGDETLGSIRPSITTLPDRELAAFFPGMSMEWLARYRSDRAAMRQSAGGGGSAPADHLAASAYLLPRLEGQLADGRPFLLGEAACLADFSVYHAFWLVSRLPSLVPRLAEFAHIRRWMGRMEAMGHGRSVEISSADALEVARSTGPASSRNGSTQYSNGLAAGQTVDVIPADTGSGQARGRLLDCSESEIAILRSDPRAGSVVVHFPRLGYRLRAA